MARTIDSTRPVRSLKVLAALLSYPTPELADAMPDLHAVLAEEGVVPARSRRLLKAFMQALAAEDMLTAEEHYVATFDRGRATSLHLFEHVHGDSRDRGQAMVDLSRVYAEQGFSLCTRELPDFLPAMLEYLSLRPGVEAASMLSECAHLVRDIGEALAARQSPYVAVFDALLDALALPAVAAGAAGQASEETDLDMLWAEEPAFPGNATSCSAAASGRGCGPAFGATPAP